MTNCGLCHNMILDKQELFDSFTHSVCRDEEMRRFYAEICIWCGKNSRGENKQLCSKCIYSDSTYRGYEGPQS